MGPVARSHRIAAPGTRSTGLCGFNGAVGTIAPDRPWQTYSIAPPRRRSMGPVDHITGKTAEVTGTGFPHPASMGPWTIAPE